MVTQNNVEFIDRFVGDVEYDPDVIEDMVFRTSQLELIKRIFPNDRLAHNEYSLVARQDIRNRDLIKKVLTFIPADARIVYADVSDGCLYLDWESPR